MLSSRMRNFLLLGPSQQEGESDEQANVKKAIAETARHLLQLHDSALSAQEEERRRKEELKAQVRALHEHFRSADIINKLKSQQLLEYTLQFTVMNETLRLLDECGNDEDDDDGGSSRAVVERIPELVLQVKAHTPTRLPRNSDAKKLLDSVVARKREALLSRFHARFEAHLDVSSSTEGAEAGARAWSTFLGESRAWLLAYAMVSLLPAVIGESRDRVMEIYQQDILEEALLPLWGRFSFHLTSAREGGSSSQEQEQLLWTFGYARSHVELLCDLCSQLAPSGGLLQQLCPGEYVEAGAKHVVDKAVRFLRAHVAEILLSLTSSGSSADSSSLGLKLMRLVENSLELDAFLNDQCPGRVPCDSLTVTAVFCDAPAIFRQWLDADFAKLRSLIEAVCFDADSVYENAFTLAAESSRHFCYKGLYEVLALFILASERYCVLPAASQAAFCAAILEPLLCISVGLLMLRIRSCETLHAISCCSYTPSASSSLSSSSTPPELAQFICSVAYYEESLSASCVRGLWTSPERFSSRLAEVVAWVPQHCTAHEGGNIRKEFEFSPFNLAVMAMPCPSADVGAGPRSGQIGVVVDAVRSHALALSTDLRRKWDEDS